MESEREFEKSFFAVPGHLRSRGDNSPKRVPGVVIDRARGAIREWSSCFGATIPMIGNSACDAGE